MRPVTLVTDAFDRQRCQLFLWSPVAYGCGIALYFALSFEPGGIARLAVAAGMVAAVLAGMMAPAAFRPGLAGAVLVAAGFSVAALRAHSVADLRLEARYYGPVEGRIVEIDRSASDAVRLTLDRVRLAPSAGPAPPGRVRIALHGTQGYFAPEPGQTVILTGHLAPPGGPVEPGGFDFQRQAWFAGLGAVGYTRNPALLLAPAQPGPGLAIERLRMRISAAVQAALPGRAGGFAAAITTGDRAGMDRATLDALRASNLAHLLAISGLHMGLLTGFVFTALRVLLAASGSLALRLPAKKVAAVAAFASGAGYLAISGGNVATERAFIMVGVMFLAVLTDRRAVTLRAVAVAALVVLTLRPESLLGPGFQMSFSATTALVAVYGGLRERFPAGAGLPSWSRALAGVALSSLVAGVATAPFAAVHFNQVPHYGLVANIVSVPLMGAVIMPAAVFAALLSPLGLGWLGLRIMEWPILWILGVAETVAAWPGALSLVVTPGPAVLPLLAFGGLVLALWRGAGRGLGLVPLALALGLWSQSGRPDVLVSESGGLVGILTADGRTMSKPRGDGFAAETWLENDGDGASQAEASTRGGIGERDGLRLVPLGRATLVHATGKTSSVRAAEACGGGVLVVNARLASAPSADCDVFDAARLARTGALAIYIDDAGPRIETARDRQGARLWSQ